MRVSFAVETDAEGRFACYLRQPEPRIRVQNLYVEILVWVPGSSLVGIAKMEMDADVKTIAPLEITLSIQTSTEMGPAGPPDMTCTIACDHLIGRYADQRDPDTALFEISKNAEAFVFRDVAGPSYLMEQTPEGLQFCNPTERFVVRHDVAQKRYFPDVYHVGQEDGPEETLDLFWSHKSCRDDARGK